MDFANGNVAVCLRPLRLELEDFDVDVGVDVPEPMPEVYIADSIKKRRWRKGEVQYLVKWKGWPSRFNTWEPKEHILDFQLIRIFEQKKLLKNQRHQVRKFASKKIKTPHVRKKQFKKSKKPGRYDVNKGGKLHLMDKTHVKTTNHALKIDHHVEFHPANQIPMLTSYQDICNAFSNRNFSSNNEIEAVCPNRDKYLQSDYKSGVCVSNKDVHCDTETNVFRTFKYKHPADKRPPIFHDERLNYTDKGNHYIKDTLNLNMEEENCKPQLDCLRSIKFKLGWFYTQMGRTPTT